MRKYELILYKGKTAVLHVSHISAPASEKLSTLHLSSHFDVNVQSLTACVQMATSIDY